MIAEEYVRPFLKDETSREDGFRNEVIRDFWICCISREASVLGRKEVLTGKAKFGILGDGKEVPQVAMARAFQKGDWRSGYYRDQTFMMALGLCSVEDYFAQLYADPINDPFSGGRQMNAHFATPTIDRTGQWLSHLDRYNVSSDISSTGGQMARGLGLAFASKVYRQLDLRNQQFSSRGDEVCFVTIGDASTSEGVFWESINAAVVEQVPLAVSVWDDGYGISVPKALQTAKSSISDALSGMADADDDRPGMDIYVAKAYDYPGLVQMYERGIKRVRQHHIPALFHIEDCTQPQGHSTSGSHERYKSPARLEWEKNHDCIEKMASWMITAGLSSEEEVIEIRNKAKEATRTAMARAREAHQSRTSTIIAEFKQLMEGAKNHPATIEMIKELESTMAQMVHPEYSSVIDLARQLHRAMVTTGHPSSDAMSRWIDEKYQIAHEHYHTHLYSETEQSALRIAAVPAEINEDSPVLNGYQILNRFFDLKLEDNPTIIAFGEDVGEIGDVNQGFAGMQEKYGVSRVFDTGIREWTIMGQAIGTAMRGLRPIAEIQYLDYLIYGLEPLSDDLATLRYRSNGTQRAPAIIRTRGHRLEGIWHAGSPLGMIINALRGMCVCVPRNMLQAAGMYNTLLSSDDPAIVIEPLNAYRLKERCPENLADFKIPLGMPEVLRSGSDITLVTYGSCVRIVESACDLLNELDIYPELIDVRTLLPFDTEGLITFSLSKTSRILFIDEDYPGGTTAYMMQQVLERQDGYFKLDSQPQSLTAYAHRPPYGSDGDYFTKPNVEDVVAKVLSILHEVDPDHIPTIR